MNQPNKKYTLSIHGCDDSTEFLLDLNSDELSLIEKLCKKSKETSTYGCMPVMEINEEELHEIS